MNNGGGKGKAGVKKGKGSVQKKKKIRQVRGLNFFV